MTHADAVRSTAREGTAQMGATESRYVTVSQFLDINGKVVGRTALYDAIRRNAIPHARIGRRIILPVDALDRLVTRQAARSGGEVRDA